MGSFRCQCRPTSSTLTPSLQKGFWLYCPVRPRGLALQPLPLPHAPHRGRWGPRTWLPALLRKDTGACAGPRPWTHRPGRHTLRLESLPPGRPEAAGCQAQFRGAHREPWGGPSTLLPVCLSALAEGLPGVGLQRLSSLAQMSWGPAGPGLEAVAPISTLSPHFYALARICPRCSRPVRTLPISSVGPLTSPSFTTTPERLSPPGRPPPAGSAIASSAQGQGLAPISVPGASQTQPGMGGSGRVPRDQT